MKSGHLDGLILTCSERGGDGHDVWPTVNPHQRTSPVRLDTAAPFVIDVRDKNPAGEKQHV